MEPRLSGVCPQVGRVTQGLAGTLIVKDYQFGESWLKVQESGANRPPLFVYS